MVKTKKYTYIGLLALLALVGCEVIPEDQRYTYVDGKNPSARTHVLIECTGFRCVNCPTAAETAQALHEMFGYSLTVVAIHPASNPFTQGVYDYTCPAADSIYQFIGGSASTPFPTGNIDLLPQSGSYFIDPTDWPAQVALAMEDTVCPYLYFTNEADTIDKNINIVTGTRPDEQIAFWLVEDSVLGAQAMPDGSVNTNYYHRHVLRAVAYDSPWGIPTDGQVLNTNMALPEGCVPKHCSIVALLLDKNDYHILQAYEKKLDFPGFMPSIP